MALTCHLTHANRRPRAEAALATMRGRLAGVKMQRITTARAQHVVRLVAVQPHCQGRADTEEPAGELRWAATAAHHSSAVLDNRSAAMVGRLDRYLHLELTGYMDFRVIG